MEIVKRGYEPKDFVAFGSEAQRTLNAAAYEICFLLNRGYEIKSASTFIGNHYLLSERQRMALARMLSADNKLQKRKQTEQTDAPQQLYLDGFNTIITLEVALSGSLLLEGMDGTIRDLAGLRGTYRIVDKTVKAVELLLHQLEKLGVKEATFYLDKQVSNSVRLRALLLEMAATYHTQISVELCPNVDSLLAQKGQVVTTDAIILDHCKSWYNLNRHLIFNEIPDAWIFRVSPTALDHA